MLTNKRQDIIKKCLNGNFIHLYDNKIEIEDDVYYLLELEDELPITRVLSSYSCSGSLANAYSGSKIVDGKVNKIAVEDTDSWQAGAASGATTDHTIQITSEYALIEWDYDHDANGYKRGKIFLKKENLNKVEEIIRQRPEEENQLKVSLDLLQKAKDYQPAKTIFSDYDESVPHTVIAYGTEWKVNKYDVNRAKGKFTCKYSNQKPISEGSEFPKIYVEETPEEYGDGSTERIFFKGQLAYDIEEDERHWKGVKHKLEKAQSKSDVEKIIKHDESRAYYQRKCNELREEGLSEKQIKRSFKSKASWKYEELHMKMFFVNSSYYPKSLFLRLSKARSNAQFNRIARKWNIEDKIDVYSFPRKTNYARYIYDLKD